MRVPVVLQGLWYFLIGCFVWGLVAVVCLLILAIGCGGLWLIFALAKSLWKLA